MCQETADVCLVMPPVTDDIFPSLGLSLLKACLGRAGVSCRVDYASTRFWRLLGLPFGRRLMSLVNSSAGEAVFAPLAGITPRRGLEGLAECIEREFGAGFPAAENLQTLTAARQAAEVWLEETAAHVLAMGPRFVGASSVFQQHNASLALLKRLKELRPGIVTAIGGPNCMGSAGGRTLKAFPFVDYVFFGEADDIFVEVVKGALSGGDNFPLPYGVLRQGDNLPEDGAWPYRLTWDLESLPLPDYDDFFASRESALPAMLNDYSRFLAAGSRLILLLEGSRGCWWGEKHPCKFCGLNGKMNHYRHKSPERVAQEIKELEEKYGHHAIFFADSIMSREAQKKLPQIMKHYPRSQNGAKTSRPHLFTEIKSNLTEGDVKNLAEIGFGMLQPGIESLSDHVLGLMGKGNTAIHHLALLKYARQYKVSLVWNFMHGFPGEEAADYEELTHHLLPLITHLQPPNGLTPLLYHKNSVYASRPEEYGLKLRPSIWYDFFAPDDDEYIADIAYTYDDTSQDNEPTRTEALAPLYDEMHRLIHKWHTLFAGDGFADRLEMRQTAETIEITDLRECRVSTRHVLTGLAKEIYTLARAPIAHRTLIASLNETEAKITDSLAALQAKKLLVKINDEYLALAVTVEYS